MKVSNGKILELVNNMRPHFTGYSSLDKNVTDVVRQWLSEVEAEQNARIAESLLSTDDAIPAFVRKQAE
jgi:hypothetical protein